MDPAQREELFEQIGRQQKLFRTAELEEARDLAHDEGISLGEALLEVGVLTAEQLRGLERAVTYRIGRDEDKDIAKIIVDSQYCDSGAVEAALQEQKAFYARTGELVRLGALLVQAETISDTQRVAAHKIYAIEHRPG